MVAYDTVDSMWVSVLMAAYQHPVYESSENFNQVQVQVTHCYLFKHPRHSSGEVPSGDGSGFTSFNDSFDSNFMGLRLQPRQLETL